MRGAGGRVVDDRVDMLGQVPQFAGLEAEDLTALAERAEVMEVRAGTILTHEGRYEGYFYVVARGSVRIDRGGQAVDTVTDGGFFGEIALRDAGPRTATVTAETDSTLLRITNEQFQELAASSPAIRAALDAEAERRLDRIDGGA
jgi:CRP-like cAMP-binding protein